MKRFIANVLARIGIKLLRWAHKLCPPEYSVTVKDKDEEEEKISRGRVRFKHTGVKVRGARFKSATIKIAGPRLKVKHGL